VFSLVLLCFLASTLDACRLLLRLFCSFLVSRTFLFKLTRSSAKRNVAPGHFEQKHHFAQHDPHIPGLFPD
jgi:hypothetical protein